MMWLKKKHGKIIHVSAGWQRRDPKFHLSAISLCHKVWFKINHGEALKTIAYMDPPSYRKSTSKISIPINNYCVACLQICLREMNESKSTKEKL